ncbi:MAG: MSHA type pilus biogenesis protein MshL [Gammaproteobacteria bacterium]|jgi:MSHA type pilus biogenesis protein MshL
MKNLLRSFIFVILVSGCAQMRPETSAPDMSGQRGHLNQVAVTSEPDIPSVVERTAFIPPPQPVPESERYTVVVNNVPARELLFALARDAQINVDIHPSIEGDVTLNAIDQTLTQILDRIANQVAMRYEINGSTVFITADNPYFRTYEVGYVNLSRVVESNVNVAVKVATTGAGGAQDSGSGSGDSDNTSSTKLTSTTYHRFWETIEENIRGILGEIGDSSSKKSENVIVNAEAGVINVKASKKQHEQIQRFVDHVLTNARRQVMIEATIVEVSLNDQYQAGVDWRVLLDPDKSGFGANSDLLGTVTEGVIDNAISSFVFGYADPNNNGRLIDLTVRLLREFGDTQVLSSPRLMALNNQTAMLKVVEELVYFTIEVTDKDGTNNSQGRTIIESEIHSVPVGLVMAVTPQISPNSEVTLTIRPTISQKVGDAVDPGTQLAGQFLGADASNITNTVPIIRVREMESVLRLVDGQIAVLGGLMQDDIKNSERSVPGLSKIPFIGDLLFTTEETSSRKTELLIFLRPVVVEEPNLETDLKGYQRFLSNNNTATPAY